jgi:hypothetical protein
LEHRNIKLVAEALIVRKMVVLVQTKTLKQSRRSKKTALERAPTSGFPSINGSASSRRRGLRSG